MTQGELVGVSKDDDGLVIGEVEQSQSSVRVKRSRDISQGNNQRPQVSPTKDQAR